MLARFIAASEENYVFRQFRYLQSRVMLHLQDELRSLEVRLWKMDDYDSKHRPDLLRSRQTDDMTMGERCKVINEVYEKLSKYGQSRIDVAEQAGAISYPLKQATFYVCPTSSRVWTDRLPSTNSASRISSIMKHHFSTTSSTLATGVTW